MCYGDALTEVHNVLHNTCKLGACCVYAVVDSQLHSIKELMQWCVFDHHMHMNTLEYSLVTVMTVTVQNVQYWHPDRHVLMWLQNICGGHQYV